jgi:hypothetical protein
MHLFLLVPNNSGSSLLHNLIATSRDVAILPGEGQFCENFIGPVASTFNIAHFFTEKENIFRNEKNYEWSVIKRQWDLHWKQSNPRARIKLQKSPPDITRPDLIKKHFEDVKFIIMVRNPYAMVEGILRANPNATVEQAARHALRCLEIQLENSETYSTDLVLRYEDLTDNPDTSIQDIMAYLNLNDIEYTQIFDVKGYVSPIKNMNDSQIKKLTSFQLKQINEIFIPKKSVLLDCGYSIIDHVDFNFKFVDKTDVSDFKSKLDLVKDNWKDYTFRQESFDVHQKTYTIPLIFSEDFESENVKYRTHFNAFADDLLEISKKLNKRYGFGYITRAILVNLPKGEIVPEHIDSGESLDVGHRVHIPITTNDSCFFTVGKEIINMLEGDMWEINNTNKIHSVENLGECDRVHLIVDWITVDN